MSIDSGPKFEFQQEAGGYQCACAKGQVLGKGHDKEDPGSCSIIGHNLHLVHEEGTPAVVFRSTSSFYFNSTNPPPAMINQNDKTYFKKNIRAVHIQNIVFF